MSALLHLDPHHELKKQKINREINNFYNRGNPFTLSQLRG